MADLKSCLNLSTTTTNSAHSTVCRAPMYVRCDISIRRATHWPTGISNCFLIRRGHRICSIPVTRISCNSTRQSNPKSELDNSSRSVLSRLEKYADDQKKHAEATASQTSVCANAADSIPKSSQLGFPSDELDLNPSASSSGDTPPSTEGPPRNLAKLIDEVATFLAPREHGDIRDVTLVCLSFAVLVYISQRLVCAYCVVSGTFNRH